MRLLTILLILTVTFVNCYDSGTRPSGSLSLTTDKCHYRVEKPISFTIDNSTDSPAYFWHCNYRIAFHIERKQHCTWDEYRSWGVICLAIYPMGVKEVEPNTVESDTLRVSEEGTYRIRIDYSWRQQETTGQAVISNEFVVR